MTNEPNSAVNVTVWDLTGAPINPKAVEQLMAFVEQLSKDENLAWTSQSA